MARKSRKQNIKPDMATLKSFTIKAAAYVRLSLDTPSQKGASIKNQQRIIENYIDEHPEFELYDTYIDSGVSGTTFERPEFRRMLNDAESGKISCIIFKDLSRLGRNAIDTGYYAEKLFPSIGIRLISINDNYDSSVDTGNISLPLTNLVNEIYAIDISNKTRSQKCQAMKDGVFVGGRSPYGYKRSPNERGKLIIDISAAETVRQIFTWALDNVSVYEIVKRLNAAKIPSPEVHISKTGLLNEPLSEVYRGWHPKTVKKILNNEIYLGRLVQGKSRRVNFVRQPTPEKEWIICNEAHEAIIPSELFETVQTLRINSHNDASNNSRTSYSANIFKGKIYCTHCSSHLERKKNHGRYIYHCVVNRISANSCAGCRIGEKDIRLAVLEQLLQYSGKIQYDINKPIDETGIISELQFLEMELSHTQDIVRSLYENLINRILNENGYRELKRTYQGKIEVFRQRIDELSQKLNNDQCEKAALREDLRILNELAKTNELTKEHVDRFVERVEVFRDGQVYVGVRVAESISIVIKRNLF